MLEWLNIILFQDKQIKQTDKIAPNITDIYSLSRCSTLVGILASQVFRVAVAISNVTGVLNEAFAMDYDQLNKVIVMSKRVGVIYADNFSPPPLTV